MDTSLRYIFMMQTFNSNFIVCIIIIIEENACD